MGKITLVNTLKPGDGENLTKLYKMCKAYSKGNNSDAVKKAIVTLCKYKCLGGKKGVKLEHIKGFTEMAELTQLLVESINKKQTINIIDEEHYISIYNFYRYVKTRGVNISIPQTKIYKTDECITKYCIETGNGTLSRTVVYYIHTNGEWCSLREVYLKLLLETNHIFGGSEYTFKDFAHMMTMADCNFWDKVNYKLEARK